MKLEDLVPTLEVCKQIPEGEFADSVFVWLLTFGEWHVSRRTPFDEFEQYPAPTMAEILKRKTGVEDWGGDYLEFLMRDLL